MYKILILYNEKNHLWRQYGTITTTSSGTRCCEPTEMFTEFETDDLDVLKEELIKVDAVYGHENVRPYKDLETTYSVEVTEPVDEEEEKEEESE